MHSEPQEDEIMLCVAEGKNSTVFSSLMPGRAKSPQVGGDPVGVGNTAGWEVREEQLCVTCLLSR